MKTLYELVKDRLEGTEAAEILWDDEITQDLADFQKTADRQDWPDFEQLMLDIPEWGG